VSTVSIEWEDGQHTAGANANAEAIAAGWASCCFLPAGALTAVLSCATWLCRRAGLRISLVRNALQARGPIRLAAVIIGCRGSLDALHIFL
jgi:hypothetical protein